MILSIIKIFARNKQLMTLLLIGLSVTSLITSALSISTIFLREVSNIALKDLPYHTMIYLAGVEKPWVLESRYESILNEDIVNKSINIYLELYELANTGIVYIDDKSIESSRVLLGIMYIPGLEYNILYSPQSYIVNNTVNICGCNISSYNAPFVDVTYRLSDRRFKLYLASSRMNYELITELLNRAYSLITGYAIYRFQEKYSNPYRLVFDEILLQGGVYSNIKPGLRDICALIVLTGSRDLYVNMSSVVDKVGGEPLNIKARSIVLQDNYIVSQMSTITSGRVLIKILFFDMSKLGFILQVSPVLTRIRDYDRYLRSRLINVDYSILSSPIYQKLIDLSQAEFEFRISMALTIIPSFLMIWITSSRIPPVVISVSRRLIALLRIRGISTKDIRNAVIASSMIWLIPGMVIGLFTGPLLINVLNYGNIYIDDYLSSLRSILDPMNIIVTMAVSASLLLISLYISLKAVNKVQPSDFLHVPLLAETPFVERGLSRSTIILLILGIYFILRTSLINPYTITASNVLVLFLQLILFILEPIVLLFGPIILIYGVSKLIISYPEKIWYIVSRIARLITRKYSVIVARVAEVKPSRIALMIVVSSFALSLLIGGFAGVDALNNMVNNTELAIHGNVDYVIAKPLLIDSDGSVNYIIGNVSKIAGNIIGKYTYAYLLLGVTNVNTPVKSHKAFLLTIDGRDYVVYKALFYSVPGETSESTPLGYILFILGNFSSIVEVPDTLSYSGNGFKTSINQVEKTFDSSILVYNVKTEERMGVPYSRERVKGVIEVSLSNIKLFSLNIVDNVLNMPAISCFRSIDGLDKQQFYLTQARVVSIPVITPVERGLITTINKLQDTIEALKRRGYNTTLVGYLIVFVKGEILNRQIVIREGYIVESLSDIKDQMANTNTYLILSMNYTILMGLVIYIIALVVICLLSYNVIYENLYTYTLLRGRGVSSREIHAIGFAEAFAIAFLSIMPGLILGVFLGYGLPALSVQTIGSTDINLETAYGVSLTYTLTPRTFTAMFFIFIIPIVLSWLIVYLMHRRVVREALTMIGSMM